MGDRSQEALESVLVDLHKQLKKKQTFEGAIIALRSIVRDTYSSSTTTEQSLILDAVRKAARLLQTRYTSRAFWMLGLSVFEEAAEVVVRPEEEKEIRSYRLLSHNFLVDEEDRQELPPPMRAGTSGGFLFDGQLTVDREPPRPGWLVAQTALAALMSEQTLARGQGDMNRVEDNNGGVDLLVRVRANMGEEEFIGLEEAIEATLQQVGDAARGPPPASKEEVAKLRVVAVTDEVLKSMDEGTECAVCREVFVSGDTSQEMPCKHSFHPDCLKPWLDEHNSCPICRYEMKTDDLEYELQKEMDKEAEEERRGAANALRGGEFMYI